MRLIFLDVDGVLNSKESAIFGTSHDVDSVYGLCPHLVSLVNRLIEDTGAKVILSSTWRMCSKQIQRLKNAGIPISGYTPDGAVMKNGLWYADRRCYEIQNFIDWNYRVEVEPDLPRGTEIEDFVIIDDDSDAEIPGHFYKTDFDFGLTDSICNAIRERWKCSA